MSLKVSGNINIVAMIVWHRKQDEAMIALFLDVSGLYAHFVVAPQGSVYPPSILGKTGRNAESWFLAH